MNQNGFPELRILLERVASRDPGLVTAIAARTALRVVAVHPGRVFRKEEDKHLVDLFRAHNAAIYAAYAFGTYSVAQAANNGTIKAAAKAAEDAENAVVAYASAYFAGIKAATHIATVPERTTNVATYGVAFQAACATAKAAKAAADVAAHAANTADAADAGYAVIRAAERATLAPEANRMAIDRDIAVAGKSASAADLMRTPLWHDEGPPAGWRRGIERFLTGLDALGLSYLRQQYTDWLGKKDGHFHVPIFDLDAMERCFRMSRAVAGSGVSEILAYLTEKRLDTFPVCRVVLLGPGGAGKTTLSDRLRGRKPDRESPATRGVEVAELAHGPASHIFGEAGEALRGVTVKLWDFGGQSLQLNTHKAFLGENIVYVLVLDSRSESEPDSWLFQIAQLSGFYRGAVPSVLVVTNIHEGVHHRQNESRLRALFPFLVPPENVSSRFFYFSCLNQADREYLRFCKALAQEVQSGILELPQTVIETVRQLESLQEKGIRFVCRDKFSSRFLKGLGPRAAESRKALLQQLGMVSYLPDAERRGVFIHTDGLTHCLYAILTHDGLAEKNGLASEDDLESYLGNGWEKHALDFVLRFAEKHALCWKEDKECYRFPDAAGYDTPEEMLAFSQSKNRREILFRFCSLPLGIFSHLVQRVWQRGRGKSRLWRNGILLHDHDSLPEFALLLERENKALRLLIGDRTKLEQIRLLESIKNEVESQYSYLLWGEKAVEAVSTLPTYEWFVYDNGVLTEGAQEKGDGRVTIMINNSSGVMVGSGNTNTMSGISGSFNQNNVDDYYRQNHEWLMPVIDELRGSLEVIAEGRRRSGQLDEGHLEEIRQGLAELQKGQPSMGKFGQNAMTVLSLISNGFTITGTALGTALGPIIGYLSKS